MDGGFGIDRIGEQRWIGYRKCHGVDDGDSFARRYANLGESRGRRNRAVCRHRDLCERNERQCDIIGQMGSLLKQVTTLTFVEGFPCPRADQVVY